MQKRDDMRVKIKEAIDHYNNNRRVSEAKMTMKSLAEKIGADYWYMSRWNRGHNFGQMTPDILSAIAKETGTDPNFLYGHSI